MKKIEELTPEECQSFLDKLFEDIDTKFERIIIKPNSDEQMGIEYSIDSMNMQKCHISISNPDLLIWMYNNKIDISIPLEQLKYDYNEMDETNSVLFEYAMEIGKIIQKDESGKDLIRDTNRITNEKYEAITRIQKELIKKI